MVMITDNSVTVITTDAHQQENKSFARLLRQLFYFPWRTGQYFTSDAQLKIQQAVANAEIGSTGEVKVVIEGALPIWTAYFQHSAHRARDLFGELGVWDTEYNSGILLYINICERKVEIVADRGINRHVDANQWQIICNQIIAQFAKQEYARGVTEGVEHIGLLLRTYHQSNIKNIGNELDNTVILL